MRFIRVHGRVVPIKDDKNNSARVKIAKGVGIAGTAYTVAHTISAGKIASRAKAHAAHIENHFRQASAMAHLYGKDSPHYRLAKASTRSNAGLLLSDMQAGRKAIGKIALGAAVTGLAALYARSQKDKDERHK
jgi:hypothetical protein